MDAAKWCEETLAEWDALNLEVIELTFRDTESSSLLRQARLRRANEKLDIATKKSNVAALVQQLIDEGDNFTLKIQTTNLDLDLSWSPYK